MALFVYNQLINMGDLNAYTKKTLFQWHLINCG